MTWRNILGAADPAPRYSQNPQYPPTPAPNPNIEDIGDIDPAPAPDDAWLERTAVAEFEGGLPRARAHELADACHPPAGGPPPGWLTWWRDELAARVPLMGQADAERRVWGIAMTLWHARHGAPADGHRCAGCGGPLGSRAWSLPDGARLHDDARLVDCLAAYGQRWRPVAAAALARLGIPTPPGEP